MSIPSMPERRVIDPACALPQLTVVRVPGNCDEAAVRKRLLDEFNPEIGAGLADWAGQVWRIGLMGYSCRRENVDRCPDALGKCLNSHLAGNTGKDEAAA